MTPLPLSLKGVIKMKKRYTFVAILTEEENGISIEFPDLPGCCPCAETMEQAMDNAKEALGLHIWGMEQDGEPIPEPTPIGKIKTATGQVAISVDVFMPSVRERIENKSIKKTLTIPNWLDKLAAGEQINYSKLFQDALINYLDINPETHQFYR